MLYGLLRVVREARVDRRGLHHGAARRDEPPESLDRRQQSNGAGPGSALADSVGDLEVRLNGLGVEVGVERPQECVLEKAHPTASSSALTHALGSRKRVLR